MKLKFALPIIASEKMSEDNGHTYVLSAGEDNSLVSISSSF